jgi:hypothetical protein
LGTIEIDLGTIEIDLGTIEIGNGTAASPHRRNCCILPEFFILLLSLS